MGTLASSGFGCQVPNSLGTLARTIKEAQDINLQTRQYLRQLVHTSHSLEIPKHQITSTRHVPQYVQADDGFAFIQISDPSGKTDSVGGSSMRSHIRKKFHENRRRREEKAKSSLKSYKVTFSLGRHHSSTATWSPVAPEQSYEEPTKHFELPIVYDKAPLSTNTCASSSGRSGHERFRADDVCTQYRRSFLQKMYDEGESLDYRALALPQNLISLNSSDPFNASAFPLTQKMHGLIHHFIHAIIIPTSPRIYQGSGFKDLMDLIQIATALSDAACLHTLVAEAGAHLAMLKSNGLSNSDWQGKEEIRRDISESRYHMSEGIRLQNEKLEDPKLALTTSSLFGAAHLGMCASYLGDAALISNHHQGLLRMISRRGGINTIPRALANQIIRMSSNIAWKKKSKATLPMYSSRFRPPDHRISAVIVCSLSAPLLFPPPTYRISLPPSLSPFSNRQFETFLCRDLFDIACDLHELSYMLDLNVRHPNQLGSVHREFFEDTYAAALHGLVSFNHPHEEGGVGVPTTGYWRQHSWRVAGMIYLNTAIREWDTPMHPTNTMIADLISSLRKADMGGMWSSFPEVLLWMLFVGTCGTWDRLDRSWLLHELRHGVQFLRLENIGQLENLLQSLLFVDSMRTRYLDVIWQELNC